VVVISQVGGEVKCFKCGGLGQYANDRAFECKNKEVVCYNCGEVRHTSTKCTKPKKKKSDGKVLALNVEEVEASKDCYY